MSEIAFVFTIVALILANTIKILREWERGVILRFGAFQAVRGPGLIVVIPLVERMFLMNTRVRTVDVPPQNTITKDNVTLTVNAVVFFHVFSPKEAAVNVEDFYAATSQKAQTVLRTVIGQFEIDVILSERDIIHHRLQSILDTETDHWGIKVDAVEIKHIDLPQAMRRAMARQAEAERERRAKIIVAEGEYQASTGLSEAARIMGRHPIAIQLRFLQTLSGVTINHNSTLVVPFPIDLCAALVKGEKQAR